MKKIKTIKFTFSLLFLINISPFTLAQEDHKDSSKILLIIGQDKDSILDYVKEIKQIPDGFMAYISIHNIEALSEPLDSGGGTQDLDFLRNKFPRAKLQIGLYMVDSLDQVVEGRYDENINKLADWFKRTSSPIFLRIGYEFDGPHNHYDPTKYVKAYRYLVDHFRSLGVKNVAYVWHSYGAYVEGDRLQWYPGDDYVDWIGVSYFDAYNNSNMEKIAKLAESKHKPFMIAEATPRGFTVSANDKVWKLWFEKLFNFIKKNKVEALSYINVNWENTAMFKGQNWGDSRIQQSDLIREKWLAEFNN